MSKKGEATKRGIIESSKVLFSQKGYLAVTMKDVCEICSLSRGGLYRYFSSTREIFVTMLDNDIDDNRHAVKEAIKEKVAAKHLFEHYANYEKKEIFSDTKGLYFAIHEFAFAEPAYRRYFDKRVEMSLNILTMIFRYGQETGEFKDFDVFDVATHILYFFDALKTSSSVLTITTEMVDRQINIIKEMIYENYSL